MLLGPPPAGLFYHFTLYFGCSGDGTVITSRATPSWFQSALVNALPPVSKASARSIAIAAFPEEAV